MIKVFFLIFEPNSAWDKIAQARRSILHIMLVTIMPLLVVGTLLETWGLLHHGKWQGRFQLYNRFTRPDIIAFEITQFILLFGMVFVCALLVFRMARTFMERLTFLQSFTTVAYAFAPMLLFHFMDAGATVYPAVPWLMGMGVAGWTLYQGIPRVMQPDPVHAFGVYLSTMSVIVLTSLTVRVITGMYLLGYMDLQHSWLSHQLANLLGQ